MRLFLACLITCLFYHKAKSQQFQNLYGTLFNDDFSSVIQLPNNGDYIVSGTTHKFGSADIYVARINSQGNFVWQNVYGGQREDIAYSSLLNINGNIVIASSSSSFNSSGDFDVLLLEISPLGDLQWSRNYRRTGSDEIPRKVNVSTSGLILCSSIGARGSISPDFYLFEVSANGSRIIWENRIDIQGNFGDLCSSIIPSRLGGFIMVGGSYTPNWLYDQVIIRLDGMGGVLGNISFGGTGNENAQDVIELPNNDLVVMGNFRLLSGAGLEYSLSLIAPDGRVRWIRTYGDRGNRDERAFGFGMLNGGGYAISGFTNSFGRGGSDVLLVTTNQNGDLVNASAFGSLNNENSSCLVVNNDNSILIAGVSNSPNGNGLNDGFLVRTNQNGDISNRCFTTNVLQNNLNLPVRNIQYNQYREGLSVNIVSLAKRISDFSEAALTCPTLPVDLLYFNGRNNNDNVVQVEWATNKEYNSDFFVLERSYDGFNWDSLSSIKSSGFSNSFVGYSYLDYIINYSFSDRVFYRLKQVDFDGAYIYYNTIKVNLAHDFINDKVLIYPLPFSDQLSVKIIPETSFNHDVSILNLAGDVVYVNSFVGSENILLHLNIDLSFLQTGVYFMSINDGVNVKVNRIIKNEF